MIIDVRLVPEGRSGLEREAPLPGYRDELPPFLKPLLCRAELDRAGGEIAISLRFDGEFEVECARCLAPVCAPVSGDLRIILKEWRGKGEMSAPASGDDGVDFFFDAVHNLVDIGPAIYDEVMTALPMRPLCSEDCAGIGVGLKPEAGERGIDPRWTGLMKLKNDVP
jgi:uncharacterized protein